MALCEHFKPGSHPYEVLLVLDDHLGPTEALVRCRACAQSYLIELLDWLGSERLFRVAEPDAAATRTLLRDLERGSCDLARAGEEVRHFSLISERLPVLLLLDTDENVIRRRIDVVDADAIPAASWRELPCDGEWIERTQAARL